MSHNLPISFFKIITEKEIDQNEKERIKARCFRGKKKNKNSYIGNLTQCQNNKTIKSTIKNKRTRYQQINNLPQLSTKESYNVKSISNSFDESSLSIPTRKNNLIIKIEKKSDVGNFINFSKEIPSFGNEMNEIKIITNTVKGSFNESETSSIEHINSKVNSGLLDQMSDLSESSHSCFELNESNNQIHSNNYIAEHYYYSPVNNHNHNKEQKRIKLEKKFLNYSKSNKYEMSYKYINDELIDNCIDSSQKNHKKEVINLSNYNFISSLNKKSKALPAIKKSSLLSLSDLSVYYLFSFCYDMFNVFNSDNSNIFSKKLYYSLNKAMGSCLLEFQKKYLKILHLESHKYEFNNFYKNNKIFPIFEIILKTKIISNEKNMCYTIKYSYKIKDQIYNHFYKFDSNSNSNITWISSEQDSKFCQKRFCQFQPIFPFKTGDYLNFHITLFSNNGIVNPLSIHWGEYEKSAVPNGFYQKKLSKTSIEFNPFRANECEKMVLFWERKNCLSNKKSDMIKKELEKFFIIENMEYGTSKIYNFYKIYLNPKYIGLIPKNRYINSSIEIVNKNEPITKEVQNLCTVDVLNNRNIIYLRINTKLILYIINYK